MNGFVKGKANKRYFLKIWGGGNTGPISIKIDHLTIQYATSTIIDLPPANSWQAHYLLVEKGWGESSWDDASVIIGCLLDPAEIHCIIQ